MSKVKLLAMGGMGRVTQNMFLYEAEEEILIVDCGIGFPDHYMPGVDILIPDISYLLKQLETGKRIVGMILSHGHDDHIAALPYLLPHLPEFPIFASALTAGFAVQRMKDGKIERPIQVIEPGHRFAVGSKFLATSFRVTHSVPDTRHFLIETPAGSIYHGTDFRIDPTPVDGQVSDLDAIGHLKSQAVKLMLLDCLRVEIEQPAQSESTISPVMQDLMAQTRGKFVMTLMSSHIHRIQQTIDSAQKLGRRVAFVGRSVEQNVKVASELKKLHIPVGLEVNKKKTDQVPDNQLCMIVAGSQGQEGSSLVRAVFGDHPILRIKPQDTVAFSANAIPGNELNYYAAIDELARNNIRVLYPDIEPGLHHSGHASSLEQRDMIELVRPELVMPIGGADRHRRLFAEVVAKPLGYHAQQILLPQEGEILELSDAGVRVVGRIKLKPQTVDGKGIGDVGPAVLSDRLSMGQAGMIVLVIPKSSGQIQPRKVQVISRGFVFMKEAEEVISFIKQSVAETVDSNPKLKDDELKRKIEQQLGRKLYKIIQREPMILPVIIEV
ncbi:MAG: ribonuclease J [Patescibacteria group bacterium]|nr:ribonuclease J [Patescibacteria group bacterium]